MRIQNRCGYSGRLIWPDTSCRPAVGTSGNTVPQPNKNIVRGDRRRASRRQITLKSEDLLVRRAKPNRCSSSWYTTFDMKLLQGWSPEASLPEPKPKSKCTIVKMMGAGSGIP